MGHFDLLDHCSVHQLLNVFKNLFEPVFADIVDWREKLLDFE